MSVPNITMQLSWHNDKCTFRLNYCAESNLISRSISSDENYTATINGDLKSWSIVTNASFAGSGILAAASNVGAIAGPCIV